MNETSVLHQKDLTAPKPQVDFPANNFTKERIDLSSYGSKHMLSS